MIKVLHAIDGRAWGGAERVVAMLASGLQKRKFGQRMDI